MTIYGACIGYGTIISYNDLIKVIKTYDPVLYGDIDGNYRIDEEEYKKDFLDLDSLLPYELKILKENYYNDRNTVIDREWKDMDENDRQEFLKDEGWEYESNNRLKYNFYYIQEIFNNLVINVDIREFEHNHEEYEKSVFMGAVKTIKWGHESDTNPFLIKPAKCLSVDLYLQWKFNRGAKYTMFMPDCGCCS